MLGIYKYFYCSLLEGEQGFISTLILSLEWCSFGGEKLKGSVRRGLRNLCHRITGAEGYLMAYGRYKTSDFQFPRALEGES